VPSRARSASSARVIVSASMITERRRNGTSEASPARSKDPVKITRSLSLDVRPDVTTCGRSDPGQKRLTGDRPRAQWPRDPGSCVSHHTKKADVRESACLIDGLRLCRHTIVLDQIKNGRTLYVRAGTSKRKRPPYLHRVFGPCWAKASTSAVPTSARLSLKRLR